MLLFQSQCLSPFSSGLCFPFFSCLFFCLLCSPLGLLSCQALRLLLCGGLFLLLLFQSKCLGLFSCDLCFSLLLSSLLGNFRDCLLLLYVRLSLLFGHERLLPLQLCLFLQSSFSLFGLKNKFLLNLNLSLLFFFDSRLLSILFAFFIFNPERLCFKFLFLFILLQLALGLFCKSVAFLLLLNLG